MKKVFVIFLTIIAAVLLIYSAIVIYIRNKAGEDTKVNSDAIVVLGERAYSGGSCAGPICKKVGFIPHPHINPCLVARVNQAVSLYKNHYASKILMSGGTDKEDGENEAETMKKIAVSAGIPETDILLEKESTSTFENLKLSQTILNKADLRSVIIVTDPYANARAELVALKLHYTYSLSPAKNNACSHPDDYFLKEPSALVGYKLLNKI